MPSASLASVHMSTTTTGRDNALPRHYGAAYALTLPFYIVFVLMLVVPLGYAAYLSLFRTRMVGGTVFSGIENYIRAVTDAALLAGIGRMLLFLTTSVPLGLLVSLLLALALDTGLVRAARFVRLSIFIPYAVPGVIATLMWGFIYGPTVGPISQLFSLFGAKPPEFLSASLITPSMMNILFWEYVGYNMIIFFAALRNIPRDLYEAAAIDGANQWQVAWYIKLPALRPALLLTVTFAVIGTFQIFNEPNLLYPLAPASIGTAFSPNLYVYNLAFVQQNMNYAAAIAFLLAAIVAIISFAVQSAFQHRAGSMS
jgi:multiple sugar transport system permease protein